jgi:hypothetical protein
LIDCLTKLAQRFDCSDYHNQNSFVPISFLSNSKSVVTDFFV